ncbi:MAG: N-acetylmuramoyl-L-alanine amidase [Sulfuricurvum sp.]
MRIRFGLMGFMMVGHLGAFDLVLDVGHTPKQSGAMSATCTQEYQYNRTLATHVARYVSQHSGIKVVVGSSQARPEISFRDRYASSYGKDLFLSLHHDSVQKQYLHFDVNGCPSSEYASGFSLFVSRKNPYFSASLAYAQKIGVQLIAQGLHPSTHHSEPIAGENRELVDAALGIYLFDDLKVLKFAKSPAVLLESGVIVNPWEEQVVRTEAYQDKIAKAIASVENP